METYHAVMAKVETLQKKAKALLDAEKARVLVEIRKIVDLYGIQASEIYSEAATRAIRGKAKQTPGKKKTALSPKYRDPATGKTWNGHGKRPFWIGQNPDDFLIDRPQPVVPPAQPVASTGAKKLAPARKAAPTKSASTKTAKKPPVKAKAPVKKKPVAKKTATVQPVAQPANDGASPDTAKDQVPAHGGD